MRAPLSDASAEGCSWLGAGLAALLDALPLGMAGLAALLLEVLAACMAAKRWVAKLLERDGYV